MREQLAQTRNDGQQAAKVRGPTRDAPLGRSARGRGPRADSNGAFASTAVGYVRRSTDRQEQSIPDQRKAVERFAAERGLSIARFYVDDAISGTSTVGRKAFQSLIADAGLPTRDFAFVVCYDVKRFGRIDNDEAGYYRHILKSHGVEVLYASENFTGDGTDDLLRPVKQWQARQESKDLAKVTIRGLLSKAGSGVSAGSSVGATNPERAAGGWWMGGAPPYGYDLRYQSQTGQALFTLRYLNDGSKQMLDEAGALVRELGRDETVAVSRRDRCKLVPGDPERVKTVEAIFRLYVEERKGFKAVTDHLNASEAPTARGPGWSDRCSGRWAMGTVRAILMNPAYKGDMVWNRRTDGRFFRIADGVAVERKGVQGRRLEPNAESDWIVTENAHAALVPRRVWERARKRREAMGAASASGVPGATGAQEALPGGRCWKGSREKFLLSGLCECGACGSRYEGVTQPSTRRSKSGEPEGSLAYACGGYIRRGPSTCARGAIPKDVIESAVVRAVVGAYERFGGPGGKAAIREEFERRFGVEREDAARARTAALAEVDRLERTTRSLLDNITKTNKAAVDKRLVEIESERAALERTLDEAARTTVSHREVETMVRETAAFIQSLETVLGDDMEAGARQAALRRCVQRVVIQRGRPAISVEVRTLPTMANGPETSAVTTVEAALPGRASRAKA